MFTQEPITEELVQEIARKIVENVHPRRIIAFGSYARGEHKSDSDLDLIVEMETDKPFYERGMPIAALFRDRRWAMDLLVYTPEEFAEQRRVSGSLLSTVEREGKVIYERS
ncbi:MAG: nucleotidyltransferase domain-containing protein [Acidobacteria bacterium]|nr:MAG: nucleotidyltransferase domain-containing protein [Acidobacteriota bacterium]PYY19182.1 MAG: nucleotidyltransferase domain-containing protein [Acidobacteriota bacterium]